MRKRVKTITEETHEYGTIVLEHPLYSALLGLAAGDDVTTEHVDIWVDKSMTLSEDVEGEALTLDHLAPIVQGTPAAVPAAELLKTV